MKKREFGQLELSILQAFRSGERLSVKEVHELLGGKDKYITIMTVMNRLVKKQLLMRERIKVYYEYWSPPTKTNAPSFLEKVKQKFLGIKTVEVVNYLIEFSEDLKAEDLDAMEKMIQKAKSSRNLQ